MTENILVHYILPLGWFVLLTGMFWAGDRSLYHRLFYLFIAAPCVLTLLLRPKTIISAMRHPIFIAFVVFSIYIVLTLSWSPSSDEIGSLIKRPLYIAIFLLSAGILVSDNIQKFERILYLSALVAILSAVLSLVFFFYELYYNDGVLRLPGYGALYNPLLTAHVYGAFASYWMVRWSLSERPGQAVPVACLAIIGVLLIETGSRTPFVALTLAFMWLLAAKWLQRNPKKSWRTILGLVVIALFALVQYIRATNLSIWASTSHRPEIWMETLRQVAVAPWFGHGYDSLFTVDVPGYHEEYDPHNIELAVLYDGGIVGLILWGGLLLCALKFAWRHRSNPFVLMASTWLVYGIGAGLTEGRAYLSRPKEHWFLIWIPMAMLFAASTLKNIQGDAHKSSETV